MHPLHRVLSADRAVSASSSRRLVSLEEVSRAVAQSLLSRRLQDSYEQLEKTVQRSCTLLERQITLLKDLHQLDTVTLSEKGAESWQGYENTLMQQLAAVDGECVSAQKPNKKSRRVQGLKTQLSRVKTDHDRVKPKIQIYRNRIASIKRLAEGLVPVVKQRLINQQLLQTPQDGQRVLDFLDKCVRGVDSIEDHVAFRCQRLLMSLYAQFCYDKRYKADLITGAFVRRAVEAALDYCYKAASDALPEKYSIGIFEAPRVHVLAAIQQGCLTEPVCMGTLFRYLASWLQRPLSFGLPASLCPPGSAIPRADVVSLYWASGLNHGGEFNAACLNLLSPRSTLFPDRISALDNLGLLYSLMTALSEQGDDLSYLVGNADYQSLVEGLIIDAVFDVYTASEQLEGQVNDILLKFNERDVFANPVALERLCGFLQDLPDRQASFGLPAPLWSLLQKKDDRTLRLAMRLYLHFEFNLTVTNDHGVEIGLFDVPVASWSYGLSLLSAIAGSHDSFDMLEAHSRLLASLSGRPATIGEDNRQCLVPILYSGDDEVENVPLEFRYAPDHLDALKKHFSGLEQGSVKKPLCVIDLDNTLSLFGGDIGVDELLGQLTEDDSPFSKVLFLTNSSCRRERLCVYLERWKEAHPAKSGQVDQFYGPLSIGHQMKKAYFMADFLKRYDNKFASSLTAKVVLFDDKWLEYYSQFVFSPKDSEAMSEEQWSSIKPYVAAESVQHELVLKSALQQLQKQADFFAVPGLNAATLFKQSEYRNFLLQLVRRSIEFVAGVKDGSFSVDNLSKDDKENWRGLLDIVEMRCRRQLLGTPAEKLKAMLDQEVPFQQVLQGQLDALLHEGGSIRFVEPACYQMAMGRLQSEQKALNRLSKPGVKAEFNFGVFDPPRSSSPAVAPSPGAVTLSDAVPSPSAFGSKRFFGSVE